MIFPSFLPKLEKIDHILVDIFVKLPIDKYLL